MKKATLVLAALVIASAATTSAAVFTPKHQATNDVARATEAMIAKVQSMAPPTMTMQRPI